MTGDANTRSRSEFEERRGEFEKRRCEFDQSGAEDIDRADGETSRGDWFW
jgi:hypothetical protein